MIKDRRGSYDSAFYAGIAQLVEQLPCKHQVPSSSLGVGSPVMMRTSLNGTCVLIGRQKRTEQIQNLVVTTNWTMNQKPMPWSEQIKARFRVLPWSKWSGHHPFKVVMRGSSPPGSAYRDNPVDASNRG